MTVAMRVAGDAIVGARADQQDHFGAGIARLSNGETARLVVIADGMGGHSGGEVASTLAVETFLAAAEAGHHDDFAETLRQALLAANAAIAARSESEPRLAGMGCTLVAVIFHRRMIWTISVGDSLFLRIGDSGIERLNADHSMAGLAGSIDGVELSPHLLRSALTGRPIPLIDEGRYPLHVDTHYLLATDGLLTLGNTAIFDIFQHGAAGEPIAKVRALLAAVSAADHPDQDNCTVIIVHTAKAARARPGFARMLAGGALAIIGTGAALAAWHYATSAPDAVPSPSGSAAGGTVAASGPNRRNGYQEIVPVPPRPGTSTIARPHGAAATGPANGAERPDGQPRIRLKLDYLEEPVAHETGATTAAGGESLKPPPPPAPTSAPSPAATAVTPPHAGVGRQGTHG